MKKIISESINIKEINPFYVRNYEIYESLISEHLYYRHPNGIVVVCLKKSHKIFEKLYDINNNSENKKKYITKLININKPQKYSGKKKRGIKKVKRNDVFCEIKLLKINGSIGEEENEYSIEFGIDGRYVEINEKLERDLEVLFRKPYDFGYLCVIEAFGREWNDALKKNWLKRIN